nr:MAG TPA: hypothetical protein [Caudoviricetes sp.]
MTMYSLRPHRHTVSNYCLYIGKGGNLPSI